MMQQDRIGLVGWQGAVNRTLQGARIQHGLMESVTQRVHHLLKRNHMMAPKTPPALLIMKTRQQQHRQFASLLVRTETTQVGMMISAAGMMCKAVASAMTSAVGCGDQILVAIQL